MPSKKINALLLACVALIATAIGVFAGIQFTNDGRSSLDREALSNLNAVLMPEPKKLEKMALETSDNRIVDLGSDFEGQWVLVNFGYLSCPDICPINLMSLSTVHETWEMEEPLYPLQTVFVTLDPKRDTMDRISPYVKHFNPDFIGARTNQNATEKLALAMNTVFYYDEPGEDGEYLVNHSDSLALINPDGELEAILRGPQQPERVLQALKMIIPTQA